MGWTGLDVDRLSEKLQLASITTFAVNHAYRTDAVDREDTFLFQFADGDLAHGAYGVLQGVDVRIFGNKTRDFSFPVLLQESRATFIWSAVFVFRPISFIQFCDCRRFLSPLLIGYLLLLFLRRFGVL